MPIHRRQVLSTVTAAVTLLCCCNVFAEKVPLSEAELRDTATHIVVGKVQAIYSRSERKGDYEYARHVAEVRVDEVEKGEFAERLIYVRFFNIGWKGRGLMPPGPSGHHPRPQTGSSYRFYLSRNADDGFSRDNQDGGFNVIYGNGAQPLSRESSAAD